MTEHNNEEKNQVPQGMPDFIAPTSDAWQNPSGQVPSPGRPQHRPEPSAQPEWAPPADSQPIAVTAPAEEKVALGVTVTAVICLIGVGLEWLTASLGLVKYILYWLVGFISLFAYRSINRGTIDRGKVPFAVVFGAAGILFALVLAIHPWWEFSSGLLFLDRVAFTQELMLSPTGMTAFVSNALALSLVGALFLFLSVFRSAQKTP